MAVKAKRKFAFAGCSSPAKIAEQRAVGEEHQQRHKKYIVRKASNDVARYLVAA